MPVSKKTLRFCSPCGCIFSLEEGKEIPDRVPLYALDRMIELGIIDAPIKERKPATHWNGIGKNV